MEFFKFVTDVGSEPTYLTQGDVINGLKSAMWVERYNTPGEFSFEAPLSSGLKEFLPVSTLISHVDTLEVMVVENHEIQETNEEDPIIIITGRSLVTILENRIVGVPAARVSSVYTPYSLAANYSWFQIVEMINSHVQITSHLNDRFDSIAAVNEVGGTSPISEARVIKNGNLLDETLELLEIDNLGIRTKRMHSFGGSYSQTSFCLYKGVDRSSTVIFSWESKDLDSTNYLFTQKNLKNTAVVIGRYIIIIVDLGPTKYARRMMVIDASDIDGHLTPPVTGTPLTTAVTAMQTRGRQELAKQTQITISQADISRTTKYQYRRDFNVGDLVTLDGNFGVMAVMRVTEYAEIEDETGESGHPTLSLPTI